MCEKMCSYKGRHKHFFSIRFDFADITTEENGNKRLTGFLFLKFCVLIFKDIYGFNLLLTVDTDRKCSGRMGK